MSEIHNITAIEESVKRFENLIKNNNNLFTDEVMISVVNCQFPVNVNGNQLYEWLQQEIENNYFNLNSNELEIIVNEILDTIKDTIYKKVGFDKENLNLEPYEAFLKQTNSEIIYQYENKEIYWYGQMKSFIVLDKEANEMKLLGHFKARTLEHKNNDFLDIKNQKVIESVYRTLDVKNEFQIEVDITEMPFFITYLINKNFEIIERPWSFFQIGATTKEFFDLFVSSIKEKAYIYETIFSKIQMVLTPRNEFNENKKNKLKSLKEEERFVINIRKSMFSDEESMVYNFIHKYIDNNTIKKAMLALNEQYYYLGVEDDNKIYSDSFKTKIIENKIPKNILKSLLMIYFIDVQHFNKEYNVLIDEKYDIINQENLEKLRKNSNVMDFASMRVLENFDNYLNEKKKRLIQ